MLYEDAPAGFLSWLDKNISSHDPVFRSWAMRDSLPPAARSLASFRCPDDRCIHYIYGFYNQEDRDGHAKGHAHTSPSHRDSAIPVSGMASVTFPSPKRLTPQPSQVDLSGTGDLKASTSRLSRPLTPRLPPLATSTQSRERLDPVSNFQVPREPAGPASASTDSAVDPFLPPLERSRIGQPRLQSIGELRLLQDAGPCMRCKVLRLPVSTQIVYPRPVKRLTLFPVRLE